jgi:hypothetical protein
MKKQIPATTQKEMEEFVRSLSRAIEYVEDALSACTTDDTKFYIKDKCPNCQADIEAINTLRPILDGIKETLQKRQIQQISPESLTRLPVPRKRRGARA